MGGVGVFRLRLRSGDNIHPDSANIAVPNDLRVAENHGNRWERMWHCSPLAITTVRLSGIDRCDYLQGLSS
jgi:hypothetical protein